VVGILIVLVSVFGAYVTWRAAAAAGTASDFDQQSRQASLLSDQFRTEDENVISYEARLYSTYRAHIRTAEALDRAAVGDRAAASRLRRESRDHRAVARALQLPLNDLAVDNEGVASYDRRASLRLALEQDPRLEELRPRGLSDAADRARDKRLALVAVDTGVIAAIFFLTLALLAARLRTHFAMAGFGLAGAAVVAIVVVQVVIDVPTL
jgi:hypothetical protein